ncbi:MAG: asparagine synthase-related protein [Caulobacter sp.]
MRLILTGRSLGTDDLAWLAQGTSETWSLGAGAHIALTANEGVIRRPDASASFARRGAPAASASEDDPEILAQITPCVCFEPRSGVVTLLAHPIGRGTFYFLRTPEAVFVSTALIDAAEYLPTLRLNRLTVADYFTRLRNTPVKLGDTFIDGLEQVPPGHAALWDGRRLTLQKRWIPNDDADAGALQLEDAAPLVRTALERVIQPHAAPGTACLVSGGLDSSAVAAIANKLSGSRVSLLTYGHGLDSVRERHLRDALATALERDVSTLPLTDIWIDVEAIRHVNRRSNSPSGGVFSGIFARLLSAARAAGYGTILTGEGGDEVFDAPFDLLADLAGSGRWGATLNALGFFSAYSYGTSAGRLVFDHALAPLAKARGLPWPRPVANPFLAQVLGAGFSDALNQARTLAQTDLGAAVQAGWSLSTYYNYRQLLDVPVYEPMGLGSDAAAIRIVNPIASLEVFRAANTLRLDQWAGSWIGFRSKRLLAFAAGDLLPYAVAYAPKTGIGNLLTHLVERTPSDLRLEVDGSVLSDAGIEVDPRFLDPRAYPPEQSLVWALLLNLCIWLDEMKREHRERRSLPSQARPVRHL